MISFPARSRESNPVLIREAFDAGRPIARILVRHEGLSAESRVLVERAEAAGIAISRESAREMRRMSDTSGACEIIAALGSPPTQDLDELMGQGGLVFLLVGLRYPSNVGFILRSAEVAGAAGVVVANDWSDSEWAEASRVSIRAERFFSVLPRALDAAESVVSAAEAAGRRIAAVETVGNVHPWHSDLVRPSLVILGSETLGIPAPILDRAAEILRIPTRGFIPSYNVQAATGILLGEWLRQTQSH